MPDSRDPQVRIISFGYGHGDAPEAHLTLDLRKHFRDPHVNPALRYLTAEDPAVREAVLGTAGIRQLIDAAASAVRAYLTAPTPAPVVVASGCVGGRHRAATVAAALGEALAVQGIPVSVHHRDLHRAVITRP